MLAEAAIPVLQLRSNAPDRAAYLRQPNLGRTLHPDSVALLHPAACDLAIIVADGLSALAIERNAIPVLAHLLPQLLGGGWALGPLTLVEQGRVAIGDAIGSRLGARCSLILIGERPGLSSPDSMGAYLTWSPHPDPHRRGAQLPVEYSQWWTFAGAGCRSTVSLSRACARNAANRRFAQGRLGAAWT